MKAIIVGHGPSGLRSKAGEYIDSFDIVIRLKTTSKECLRFPKVYGTRVDILGGSWTIGPILRKAIQCPEYWIFFDSRHNKISEDDRKLMARHYIDKRLVMLPALCSEWDETYRRLLPQFSQFGCHPHTSSGFKAVLYACEVLQPAKLVLYAFDAIRSGGQHTWSITRGKNWSHYPGHNFRIEAILIDRLRTKFQMALKFA